MEPDVFASELRNIGSLPSPAPRLSHLPRPVKPRAVASWGRFGATANGPVRHLVMMVKSPAAGRVKTRLAQGIGAGRATAFYRSMTNSVLSRLAQTGQWQTYLAIAPDSDVLTPAWPMRAGSGEVYRMAQGGGDLGTRMQRIMDGMPAGPVVIVGSDIPGISNAHIGQAFQKLGRSDAVFGPSPDGGYWLFGMARRQRVAQAFSGVRWSTSDALGDTLANLAGMKVAQVGELGDVDDCADLSRLGGMATRRVLPV